MSFPSHYCLCLLWSCSLNLRAIYKRYFTSISNLSRTLSTLRGSGVWIGDQIIPFGWYSFWKGISACTLSVFVLLASEFVLCFYFVMNQLSLPVRTLDCPLGEIYPVMNTYNISMLAIDELYNYLQANRSRLECCLFDLYLFAFFSFWAGQRL